MVESSSSASSDQTTAFSEPSNNNGFICTICFKIFSTGQALGGHQQAHMIERSFRQGTPNILGAVLNHSKDDIRSLASALARSHARNLPPPRNGGRRRLIVHREEPPNPSKTNHLYHPYERNEALRRYRMTKNLIGEWKPVKEIMEREAMKRSTQKVSDDDDGTIDLELSLKRRETLDLELKLGF